MLFCNVEFANQKILINFAVLQEYRSMEAFFRTHTYLVEHTHTSVRRTLMDEIDWHSRLIGIKGARGVGKTTFLLEYVKEHFNARDRRCLYINMNHFYFQGRGIHDFAGEFYAQGGRILLIDQIFKKAEWSQELRRCYDDYPMLQIIFTGSSVMQLRDDPMIGELVSCYSLRGFSFREYINLKRSAHFIPHSLERILHEHENIASEVTKMADVATLFKEYLHHGFYPFFQEQCNYSENLLKTMNMMIEVDILLIQQIELKYLTKIKKLYYLLAMESGKSPNISKLAEAIDTSRATVMNYIKYLADARLINIVYHQGGVFPKKPAMVVVNNPNLIYTVYPHNFGEWEVYNSFFINQLRKEHKIYKAQEADAYRIDNNISVRICSENDSDMKSRGDNKMYYVATHGMANGKGRNIPLWLFGFLY